MLIIIKNSLVIGIELKYNIKQNLNNLDHFFKLIKILNNKVKNNEISYAKINTNKKNIYLIDINDEIVLEIIKKEIVGNIDLKEKNNNCDNKIIEKNRNKNNEEIIEFNEINFDFDLKENHNENQKEKIKVGIEKSFEDFSSFFWNN